MDDLMIIALNYRYAQSKDELDVDGLREGAVTDEFGKPMASDFRSAFTTREAPTGIRGNVFSSIDARPLRGVTVAIQGTEYKARTNVFGDFMFEDVDARGEVVLDVDGSSFKPQAGDTGGARYGTLHKKMTVARGEMNDLRPTRPFFMTPINEKTATFIPADAEVIVNFNNQIPGLKLYVPAGAANFPDGSKEGTITATQINPQFVPAALPDGSLPLIHVQLEPDGLTFSEPAPIEMGLDPRWGFTVGDKLGFASYGATGEYQLLGNGTVMRDDNGELIVKSDPGVGITTFSGIDCFYYLTGFAGSLRSTINIVMGEVRSAWDGSPVANVPVTIDFTGSSYGTDGKGAYTIPVNFGLFNTLIPIRVFCMIPTSWRPSNWFGSDDEPPTDPSNVYYFPFMSDPFYLNDDITFARKILVDAIFVQGDISYKDKNNNYIRWDTSILNGYTNEPTSPPECDCPETGECQPYEKYCETVPRLVKVSKPLAKDTIVQFLPFEPPRAGEDVTPYAEGRARWETSPDGGIYAVCSYWAVIFKNKKVPITSKLMVAAFDPHTGYLTNEPLVLQKNAQGELLLNQRLDLELRPSFVRIRVKKGEWMEGVDIGSIGEVKPYNCYIPVMNKNGYVTAEYYWGMRRFADIVHPAQDIRFAPNIKLKGHRYMWHEMNYYDGVPTSFDIQPGGPYIDTIENLEEDRWRELRYISYTANTIFTEETGEITLPVTVDPVDQSSNCKAMDPLPRMNFPDDNNVKTRAKVNINNWIIYLTFDDGPGKGTEEAFHIVQKKGIVATWFLLYAHVNGTRGGDDGITIVEPSAETELLKEMASMTTVTLNSSVKMIYFANHSLTHYKGIGAEDYYLRRNGLYAAEDIKKAREKFTEPTILFGPSYSDNFAHLRLPGRNTWNVGNVKSIDPANNQSFDSTNVVNILGSEYKIYGWDEEYLPFHAPWPHKCCHDLNCMTDKLKSYRRGAHTTKKPKKIVLLTHEHMFKIETAESDMDDLEAFIERLIDMGYSFQTIDKY